MTIEHPETHTAGMACVCVADHNPEPRDLERHHIWPLGRGGPDVAVNVVAICPSTHTNSHILERAWFKASGSPSWEIRRQFNFYTRELARRAYQSTMAQTLVP